MSEDKYLLKMTGIIKNFPGVKALDNVHLNVRPGTIHALIGENGAGKSTMMKCLFGIYKIDSGFIKLNGKNTTFSSPKEALYNGISMVHQELVQVPELSVMDNIWLGRYFKNGLIINNKMMYKTTKKYLDDFGIHINPKAKIKSLSVCERQLVEIVKAVTYDSKIIVLDEPTSSLAEKEVDLLFRIIMKLKERGCSVIYISHKMEEILKICDEVTVMRDGKWVACEPANKLTIDKMISLMVGRDITNRFPLKDNTPGEVILKVEHLNSYYVPKVIDVSFELREGEVLGIAGLVGARRTELVETIYGIRKKESGTITYKGKVLNIRNAMDSIKNGFALVTEDRRETGIFSMLSVRFNSIIANIRAYGKIPGVISDKEIKSDTKWIIDSLNVKTPSQKTLIRALSGGNQQKIIIGRWLLTKPNILILDEPTRGIDVGAKYEIYQLISNLANEKKGIIVVSSEMSELLGIADRILVMSNGHAAGFVDTQTTTQEEILRLATSYI